MPPRLPDFRSLDSLSLADLEAIRLVLTGGSVIDWHRLNFSGADEARDFLGAQEFDLDIAADRARATALRDLAISYLRRHFDFPVPRPVAETPVEGLLLLASAKGHRQLCACTILKVMHIIHHLEARELLFMLPVSDAQVFHLVEEKVYRVIGGMLARGFPILEFIGGRKNKDSLYTKLLSKREVLAANIYDKLRFRIVTRTPADIFPTLQYLMRHVFPFNYVIPGQSTNTMFPFRRYTEANPHLRSLLPNLQSPLERDDDSGSVDNRFTAQSYRVVHFVVDMPLRVPHAWMAAAPKDAVGLGSVIFAQTEFQVIDRETEQSNEIGDASHSAYKTRQKMAVMRRLKLGARELPEPTKAPSSRPSKPATRASKKPKAR